MMYVFDTNIWVAGLRSRRGASFILLKAIRQRWVIPAVSEALFLEYTEVLKRDQNLQNFRIFCLLPNYLEFKW
ncbi:MULTISPECIES: PIN domain-containing protein [unclassified Roseofilum]|uniref:PIN domain-containing protein n=1 Tax=unclassified Roseofilum TaxID=2620099 RepID=UPI00298D82C4|nr:MULTISPECIES: PIN domain-containing protein [unclassified Roseofilum]